MGYILNIETSGTNCSVAVSKETVTVALAEANTGSFSHAEKLHVFIKQVLEETGVTANDIDAVAVSRGPGSYTGLRIGVSAVKGLCFAWDKPLIAVDTLEVLALQGAASGADYIIPLLDARRMEVYAAVFSKEMHWLRGVEAEIIEKASYQEYLVKGTVVFLGDGALKLKELISHANAVFLADKFPSANHMPELTYKKYLNGQFEDVAYFEPFYLKDFMAGKKG